MTQPNKTSVEPMGKGWHLGDVAFPSFFLWAGQNDDILMHFNEDTGIDLKSCAEPINQMIDKATGNDPVKQFHDWLIINYWGQEEERNIL